MQATPSYEVSPGNKGATVLVAQPLASGPGVLTPSRVSNLDLTGMRIVKRGCVVEFPGGSTARVARVRLGYFFADVAPAPHPCRSVRVVA